MGPIIKQAQPLILRAGQPSDQNRNTEVFAAAAAFLILAFLGLVARLSSKRIKRRALQVDDLLLVWAFVLSVAEACSFIWAAKYAGLGHHMATLEKAQIIAYEKVFYADSLIQPCLLASAKISVLILLHRIFITKAFQLTVKILMGIVLGWYIAISFAGAFICIPVSSSWNPALPGHCGNRYLLNIVDPIPWILTDFAILICPLPMVRKLQMPTRQKIALAGLFLIGGLTCIVSCIRYRYAFFSLADPTWDTVALLNWNVAEANVTILCASLIASKPVAMFLIPDRFFSLINSFITQSFRSQHVRLVTETHVGKNGDRFGSQSHIKDGRSYELDETAGSMQSRGSNASKGVRDNMAWEDCKTLSLPQPAQTRSRT